MGRWIDYMELYGDIVIAPKVKVRDIKKPKSNNNVPKSIKGDYDLSIHGNKIVLVDNVNGTTVEAKCHPDDDFDIGVGTKEAFKKLNEKREKEKISKEIKVGDWVEVENQFAIFPVYTKFFIDNGLYEYGTRYRYGSYLKKGDELRVVFIKDNKCVLERIEKLNIYGEISCIYLMEAKGLRKVENPQ